MTPDTGADESRPTPRRKFVDEFLSERVADNNGCQSAERSTTRSIPLEIIRRWTKIVFCFVLLVTTLLEPPAFAIDKRREAVAADARKKASTDYAAKAYHKAAIRLQKALSACRAGKCAAGTVAALLRDLGVMQVRRGDKKGAKRSFVRAVALAPSLDLDSPYDEPDVRAVWEQATGKKRVPRVTPFLHTPAIEQQVDTPLPIYVEGGGEAVVRVAVEYRGTSMTAWKEIPLDRVGNGWGGLVPCTDVTAGQVVYYIEGFDSSDQRVVTSADAEHPYTVPIHQERTAEAPHLPGSSAPAACTNPSKVNPPPPVPPPAQKSAPPNDKPVRRFWIGAAGSIEFMPMPSGDELCQGDPATGYPANTTNLYCTLNGVDFPTRAPSIQNGDLVPGQGGHSNGGFPVGDIRAMLAIDYALSQHVLLGARLGWVFRKYPGSAAVTDGRAFGPPLHLEARVALLLGPEPLVGDRLVPMLFVAGGASTFDTHTASNVQLAAPGQAPQNLSVEIWRTNGPAFAAMGAGVHLTLGGTIAAMLAARANASFGANGIIPTFGPELTLQYGF